jgi:deazaflavin-dependent oxidoreductase (nitroreductase family)
MTSLLPSSVQFRDHLTKTRALLLTRDTVLVFTDLNREQRSRKVHPEEKMNATDTRYIKPKTATGLFNATVARLTRMGISVAGSRVLAVRGRSSGEWRTTPVNPLTVDGTRYLVAPRGNTQWVRNLRAVGTGELRVGRRAEPFSATEVKDDDKPAILREYLKHWKWEVGVFFDGVDAKAPTEKLREIAPGYPVFRVEAARSAPAA